MTRSHAAAMLAIAVAVMLTGGVMVSATPTTSAASGTVPPAPVTATSEATTTTARGPLGSGRPVTIAFAGDTHFEAGLRSRLAAEGAGMLAPVQALFEGSDLQILNLETAITDRGTPQDKEWTFRAPPSALDALAGIGVDAVSMANNHGLDFGAEGLQDSLAARDTAPLAVLGIGRNATDALRPYTTTVNGQRIAVIAATQVLDSSLISSWTATDASPGLASAKDVDRLTAAVAAARALADTVVVFLHWGVERETCPSAAQEALVLALQAAGADIVVGSHAHRLLGAGMEGATFVAYGLGNFGWFNETGANADTGALFVTATGRHIDGYQWHPARIRNGVPTALDGGAADTARADWDGLRACTDLTP